MDEERENNGYWVAYLVLIGVGVLFKVSGIEDEFRRHLEARVYCIVMMT